MVKTFSPWLDRVPDSRQYPRLDRSITADVVVVGGGIVGVMTAWHLVKRGQRVVLLKKNHIATGDSAETTGFFNVRARHVVMSLAFWLVVRLLPSIL